ncbi:tRNA lysidine(34) synthetase TilS [Parapedobacter sp. 10938]|uniref:tRNA lysidine(34) synthetase TilS n=1 Tax=Parapedobacter flavus TaxID=3110225 RepID=UPI002DBC5C1F|nr:tRNA lysidine(34) synthetase TilS [Parapedobacter sp. 10938]MEC3881405.1 tRNA lysidine(34) synthetase TilS [Parapedobacter sp. 10938]
MNVQERFSQFLDEQRLCQPDGRILLAVSGGKDSVLMTHLFAAAGYPIGIAHCNFQLRGAAADADEALVNRLARQLDVPFYTTAFDTGAYAQAHGISIQMAARDLRYAWLETIRGSQGYDCIAVAQHQNDHLETLLLNLVRGTGLSGLRGIQSKRGRIIRPLLFLTAAEVAAEVAGRGLDYRDDASNFSTKYARNKIRLEVIPKLKELNPALEHTMAANMAHFSGAYVVVQRYVAELRDQLFVPQQIEGEEEWHIPTAALMGLDPQPFLLYELFKPYGFTETVLADLTAALPGIPGKQFSSPSHVLHLDREVVVMRRSDAFTEEVVTIHEAGESVCWGDYRLESGWSTDTVVRAASHIAQFDADLLVFPLQIRSWHPGDAFQPLGMKGSKKLSDFFVSLKIPVYRKHRVPIVINGNGDIIWVVPYRMDNRYKITAKTKKVFTLARL